MQGMSGNGEWHRLIRDLQAGLDTENNFRKLFSRFYPPVYHFFANRGIPAEDSHDLTQDTFIRVYDGIGGFRWDSRFETWLFRIAGNLRYNYWRNKKTKKRDDHGKGVPMDDLEKSGRPISTHDVAEVTSGSGRPLGDALADEQLEVIRDAIKELPPQMRRCMVLQLRELKMREIADLMKVSVNTVKAHSHQARKRLKPLLSDYFDAGGPEDDEEKENA